MHTPISGSQSNQFAAHNLVGTCIFQPAFLGNAAPWTKYWRQLTANLCKMEHYRDNLIVLRYLLFLFSKSPAKMESGIVPHIALHPTVQYNDHKANPIA